MQTTYEQKAARADFFRIGAPDQRQAESMQALARLYEDQARELESQGLLFLQ
jgi:hypothetical protein